MNRKVLLPTAHVKSSHRRCSIKKVVLKNFAKFTEKHLYQSLFFNEVAGLRQATLKKKRHWHRCFPVNFAKFSRKPFLQNISRRLLLSRIDHFEEKLLKRDKKCQLLCCSNYIQYLQFIMTQNPIRHC